MVDNHNLQQQPEEVQLEEEEVEHREEVHEPPEYTTIVYQDKVGVTLKTVSKISQRDSTVVPNWSHSCLKLYKT